MNCRGVSLQHVNAYVALLTTRGCRNSWIQLITCNYWLLWFAGYSRSGKLRGISQLVCLKRGYSDPTKKNLHFSAFLFLAKVRGCYVTWECVCQICSDACGLCLLNASLMTLTAVELAMKRLTLRIILHEGEKKLPTGTKKMLSEAVFWICTSISLSVTPILVVQSLMCVM